MMKKLTMIILGVLVTVCFSVRWDSIAKIEYSSGSTCCHDYYQGYQFDIYNTTPINTHNRVESHSTYIYYNDIYYDTSYNFDNKSIVVCENIDKGYLFGRIQDQASMWHLVLLPFDLSVTEPHIEFNYNEYFVLDNNYSLLSFPLRGSHMTSIFAEDDGIVHIIYPIMHKLSNHAFIYTGKVELMYIKWDASTDTEIMRYTLPINTPSSIMVSPDITVDSYGRAHIAYIYKDDRSTSDYGVGYCCLEEDNGIVSIIHNTPAIYDNCGYICQSPDITVDNFGKPHIVCYANNGSANEINILYIKDTSPFPGHLTWTQYTLPHPTPQSEINECYQPRVDYGNGLIHICYEAVEETSCWQNTDIYYTNTPSNNYSLSTPICISDMIYEEWTYYANFHHVPCLVANDTNVMISLYGGYNVDNIGSKLFLVRGVY